MGKVSEFIERQKEGVRRAREKKAEREGERFMRDKMRLERQEMLEERRAGIRAQQAKHIPKVGRRTSSAKGTWEGFRNYATDFSQKQQQTPSSVGSFGLGSMMSPYAQPEKPKPVRARPRYVRARPRRRRRR